jgi:hypothetical protein
MLCIFETSVVSLTFINIAETRTEHKQTFLVLNYLKITQMA